MQRGAREMTDLTPFDALDIVESCLEHFADDPLVAEAAAVLAATLEQHRELESIATDLVKWFTDPPDCPLFDLVNRARAYVGKEQLK